MPPSGGDARAISSALANTCTQAGATCTWFDEARAIFTLSTGDKDFFVQVLEQPPELDVEQERQEYQEIDLLALEQEQLAAYPEEDN